MTSLNPALNNRTRGIAALIEGFFAFVWFGWGQVAAPQVLRHTLQVELGLDPSNVARSLQAELLSG